MHLVTDPWIPCTDGTFSLREVLGGAGAALHSGSGLEDAALLRLLSTLRAAQLRSGLDPDTYLTRHAARLSLFGDAPFFQLPAWRTAALEAQSLNALHLTRATGRDVTLLGGARDHVMPPHTAAEALLALITYQQFGPSRGRTAWGYAKDAPLARPLTFHAEGETLAETLALNTPEPASLGDTPTWETYPDPQDWGQGRETGPSVLTTTAYPWWSVTLIPDAPLRGVRLAQGRLPAADPARPSPDPHLHQLPAGDTGNKPGKAAYHVVKNPQRRSACAALCAALRDTLAGADGEGVILPLSFRRARESVTPPRFVTVTGLSTRAAQPVVLAVLRERLPWPEVERGQALSVLSLALETGDLVFEAARRGLSVPLGVKAGREAAWASGVTGAYWRALWPDLTLALLGQEDRPLEEAASLAAAEALRGAASSTPSSAEAWRVGRATMFKVLREGRPGAPEAAYA